MLIPHVYSSRLSLVRSLVPIASPNLSSETLPWEPSEINSALLAANLHELKARPENLQVEVVALRCSLAGEAAAGHLLRNSCQTKGSTAVPSGILFSLSIYYNVLLVF